LDGKSLAHIIFSSVGSGGDVLPFLRIGQRLKERGHEVTLISHCCYRVEAEKAGLHFAALDNQEEYGRFVRDEPLLNTPRGIPEFLRRHSLSRVVLEYELIKQQYHAGHTLLITRDLFDTAARIAADRLGIPWAVLFVAPSQITTWKIRVGLFRSSLASDIDRIRAQVGLLPVREWDSWLACPAGSMGLWPDWFAASDCTWPADLTAVGFMLDNEAETGEIPDDVQLLLDNGEAPILITSGTGMYLGAEFYTVSAEACRLSNRRALLVTQHEEQVPKHLPDSVRRFSYLPFGKLMDHVGAVIHHGGRGTLSCAIAAGIPQLVLAKGADRPDNAFRLHRLGVAEYLPPPKWKPEIVAESLHRLTNSSVVSNRCKELATLLRGGDAARTACELIEKACGD
jgi:UDP:flavonoid glycosyltransferase YjiC (YdhE family)